MNRLKLKDVNQVWQEFAKRGHMTYRAIAEAAGISLVSVNKIFAHNKPVTQRVMFKLATAIDLDMTDVADPV
jgi:plasmid maintenance system antidote protein VapI